MWAPPPPERPPVGWWTMLSFDRWVAGIAADMRDREEAAERAKRLRRLRRRVERIDEQLLLAASTAEARAHLRRRGFPPEAYERSADHHSYADESYRGVPVEHSTHYGQVLRVW